MITTEQKLAALRMAREILWNLPGPRDVVCVIPPPISELDVIIADLEHLPALIDGALHSATNDDRGLCWCTPIGRNGDHEDWCVQLRAALAHFTEAGGQG